MQSQLGTVTVGACVCAQENTQQQRVDMTLHDASRAQGNSGRRNGRNEWPLGVCKRALVMRVGLAQRIGDGACLVATPGAACSLQVIGGMWWQVVHHHCRDTTNVDTHLHGG
ncbi:hypothetical protein D3C81_683760 [compost metagenome]